MYIYVCMYILTSMHVNMYTCIICMYVCLQVYVYTYVCM